MILIGQYDSPFTRRVAIAMALYGIAFRHEPWSVGRDMEKIRAFNPLMRVPTLVLDDGEALIETAAILDYLDEMQAPERRLHPQGGPARRQAFRIVALATGISDKAVQLFFEKAYHEAPSPLFVERCRMQIVASLSALEAARAALTTPFWFEERVGHADIAVAASIRHLSEAHPGIYSPEAFPALAMHCARLEAMPVFSAHAQAFVAPAARVPA